MDFINTFFSGGLIDRMSGLRKSNRALAKLLEQPEAMLLPVRNGELFTDNGHPALFQVNAAEGFGLARPDPDRLIYLGRRNHQDLFAVDISNAQAFEVPAGWQPVSGRDLLQCADPETASVLAYTRGMLNWHDSHQHCGRCGAGNVSKEGGFVMECSACGQRSFPRLDPAIIVLVQHEDRCLLGRQAAWPEHRFSTIAGFAEPGENLEDAVRREVAEETNIRVGSCSYLASQPWPFPAALMIGFHAKALSTDIRLNDGELAAAGWFTREQLGDGSVILPPQQSIAFQLIAAWHDEQSERRLADIPATAEFNAPKA